MTNSDEVSWWTRRRRAIAEVDAELAVHAGSLINLFSSQEESETIFPGDEVIIADDTNCESEHNLTHDSVGITYSDGERSDSDLLLGDDGCQVQYLPSHELSRSSSLTSLYSEDDVSSDHMFSGDYDLNYLDNEETHDSNEFQISHSALSALLGILQSKHPNLPKDPRTLLSTPPGVLVHNVAGGHYHHFGIKTGVVSKLNGYRSEVENMAYVSLQINIDGLPIFKSSAGQFWPILGMIDNLSQKDPFEIGIYYGTSKPSCNVQYLSFFKEELNQLAETGIDCFGINFSVRISALMCDAPARSFVKGIKGHSGYNSCERCTTSGTWCGRMTFPILDAPLRDDASFDARDDEAHHTGSSPLSGCLIPLGMVSQVPLDYMHLVCLGVMRRLLVLWLKGPKKQRIGGAQSREISGLLESLRSDVPCEFARKPRSLTEIDRWKATEFRQFLLYTGPLVLAQSKLNDSLYKHFLLLSIAMRILLSPTCCADPEMIDYSEELILKFVEYFGHLYGKELLVYNVHCLIHLPQDARVFGSLDNISCFPFENFLGKIKKLVRKPSQPLQQVVHRLTERKTETSVLVSDVGPRCRKLHIFGSTPNAILQGFQYKELHLPCGVISTAKGDNCILVNDRVVMVKNIVVSEGTEYVVFQRFRHSDNFFSYPLESTDLGICLVSMLNTSLDYTPVADIQRKMVLLPHSSKGNKASYLAIPLLHN
ncbi:uncharacterized protein LOC134788707 [Penaeus indicus]|uniref:uncharacterized protein LOC134788707 n=1 Tax=Penaeus indicus TaxID=29960 RepID=UPI00300CD583